MAKKQTKTPNEKFEQLVEQTQTLYLESQKFESRIGLKILKSRFEKFEELPEALKTKEYDPVTYNLMKDAWPDVPAIKFSEIATSISNMEMRRIAVTYLSLESIVAEVNPKTISQVTLKKTTTWINPITNKIEDHTYDDKYELLKVERTYFEKNGFTNVGDRYIVKCYCNSTGRMYLIWVNIEEARRINNRTRIEDVTAIDAIAWTVTTNEDLSNIESITRQGDCFLFKLKDPKAKKSNTTQHLSSDFYNSKLRVES